MSANTPKLAVLVKGWPRLSETFIAQELVALQDAGHTFDIWSLRHPTDTKRHPLHDRFTGHVHYLPEYLYQEPRRVWSARAIAQGLPGYGKAYRVWRQDLRRDPTHNRIRRFGQACVLAAELPGDTRALYAHFMHTPSSVARYAAIMRGVPWSFSAHAKDIWTSPDWEKREKLQAATLWRSLRGHLHRHRGATPARFGGYAGSGRSDLPRTGPWPLSIPARARVARGEWAVSHDLGRAAGREKGF